MKPGLTAGMTHRFTYRVFSLFLDLDETDDVGEEGPEVRGVGDLDSEVCDFEVSGHGSCSCR